MNKTGRIEEQVIKVSVDIEVLPDAGGDGSVLALQRLKETLTLNLSPKSGTFSLPLRKSVQGSKRQKLAFSLCSLHGV